MKSSMILSAGLLMAGAMFGQKGVPGTAPPTDSKATQSSAVKSHARRGALNWQDRMTQRLTAKLNLTPDQQNRVRAIFKESRDQNEALSAEIRDERMALRHAVKTNDPAKIDQIMEANQGMNAKVGATYLKAMAKVYALLTPEQKAKFDTVFAGGKWARTS